jgi:hypothetical protein
MVKTLENYHALTVFVTILHSFSIYGKDRLSACCLN